MSKRKNEFNMDSPRVKKFLPPMISLGRIGSVEELNLKVLVVQNRKLSERLIELRNTETELQDKITHLEKRLKLEDGVLRQINLYWSRLDENLRVLLLSLDSEYLLKPENDKGCPSFLTELSSLNCEEIADRLANKVSYSVNTAKIIIETVEKFVQRNNNIIAALKGTLTKELLWDLIHNSTTDSVHHFHLDDIIKNTYIEVQSENVKLFESNVKLIKENDKVTVQLIGVNDKISSKDSEIAELTKQLSDMEYEMSKLRKYTSRLENNLSEAMENIQLGEELPQDPERNNNDYNNSGQPMCEISASKLENLEKELAEEKELSASRLEELEALQTKYCESVEVIENLRSDLKELPGTVICETVDYKCLQSKFSVFYLEHNKLIELYNETKKQISDMKQEYAFNIDKMEKEELAQQQSLRRQLLLLEDSLAQKVGENRMLKLELESQKVTVNDGHSILIEMRELLKSLQSCNKQLKNKCARYKKGCEANATIVRELRQLLSESEKMHRGVVEGGEKMTSQRDVNALSSESNFSLPAVDKTVENLLFEITTLMDGIERLDEEERCRKQNLVLRSEEKDLMKENDNDQEESPQSSEETGDSQEATVEILQAEVEKTKNEMNEMRRKMLSYEKIYKILLKLMEQEEAKLLEEMELTGQALEQSQEQNKNILQLLREKDEAYFKQIGEGLKLQTLRQMTEEENKLLEAQICELKEHLAATSKVVNLLTNKEQSYKHALVNFERELNDKNELVNLHKKKAIECSQSAADLKLRVDKCEDVIAKNKQIVAEKTSELERVLFKMRRLQEEVLLLKKKWERIGKLKVSESGTMDQVVREELKEYKDLLNCNICKVKRKDAVLTKCYHVFCEDCIKTRYNTRQRKCPKCNSPFGIKDYRRLYLF